jgi:hypothetical protein
MKKLMKMTSFHAFLLVALVFGVDSSTVAGGQSQAAGPGIVSDARPNPTGSNPKPEDAASAILAAFEKYEVVGMSAAHGNKDLDDFILDLIRNPGFPSKVNDIAVECGNSLYQPVLDRYIAGDDVPMPDVRLVWRNTTQTMCGMSGFYAELFPLVRRINQKLPREKKLRVLACDPPIDWSKVQSQKDFRVKDRDANIASVMKEEVLSKHRKALMLFGTYHLFRAGNPAGRLSSAVEQYEKDYPGVTLVIADHEGFCNWTALTKYNDEFEARLTSWPVPSLVQQMKGTWLADLLDMPYSAGAFYFKVKEGPSGKQTQLAPVVIKGFSRMVDAYLYLGPRDLQLSEAMPAEISMDKDYVAELQRRATLMEEDPLAILKVDSNPFLYDPDFLQKAIQDICKSHLDAPCMILPEVQVSDIH